MQSHCLCNSEDCCLHYCKALVKIKLINILGFFFATFEPCVANSEQVNLKLAALYGYKYPNNVVPVGYFPAKLIDLSDPRFHKVWVWVCMPIFSTEILGICMAVFPSLGMYSIHIRGKAADQY